MFYLLILFCFCFVLGLYFVLRAQMSRFWHSRLVFQETVNLVNRLTSAHFDEGVSRAVVGDGQAERVFGFNDLRLFGFSPHVREDEVLQTDLTAQQLLHVHFVWVQRAEEDLEGENKQTCLRLQTKWTPEPFPPFSIVSAACHAHDTH